MSDIGLITTEYGLREIPRNALAGYGAPSPKQYAELNKALRRYQAQHPGLMVMRDDRSALQGGIVLVWMPGPMFEQYRARLESEPFLTVRRFFTEMEAEEQAQRELDANRLKEITDD